MLRQPRYRGTVTETSVLAPSYRPVALLSGSGLPQLLSGSGLPQLLLGRGLPLLVNLCLKTF